MGVFDKFFASKKPWPDTKYVIKEAFEIGGIQYYEFDTIFNLPYMRGLSATSVYEEVRMKVDLEFLQAHTAAKKNIYAGTRFGLKEFNELRKLDAVLEERLKWIIVPKTALKLASIVYFDKNENPLRWEQSYSEKKIKHWNEHEGLDFFLRNRLSKLIPFLNDVNVNFQSYSEMVDQLAKSQLELISSHLSDEQKEIFKGLLQDLSSTEIRQS